MKLELNIGAESSASVSDSVQADLPGKAPILQFQSTLARGLAAADGQAQVLGDNLIASESTQTSGQLIRVTTPEQFVDAFQPAGYFLAMTMTLGKQISWGGRTLEAGLPVLVAVTIPGGAVNPAIQALLEGEDPADALEMLGSWQDLGLYVSVTDPTSIRQLGGGITRSSHWATNISFRNGQISSGPGPYNYSGELPFGQKLVVWGNIRGGINAGSDPKGFAAGQGGPMVSIPGSNAAAQSLANLIRTWVLGNDAAVLSGAGAPVLLDDIPGLLAAESIASARLYLGTGIQAAFDVTADGDIVARGQGHEARVSLGDLAGVVGGYFDTDAFAALSENIPDSARAPALLLQSTLEASGEPPMAVIDRVSGAFRNGGRAELINQARSVLADNDHLPRNTSGDVLITNRSFVDFGMGDQAATYAKAVYDVLRSDSYSISEAWNTAWAIYLEGYHRGSVSGESGLRDGGWSGGFQALWEFHFDQVGDDIK